MGSIKRIAAFLLRILAKIVIWVIVFFGTFILYHIIFSSYFPVDENNVLQAPDWYIYVGISVSIIAAFFSTRKKKTDGKVSEKTGILKKAKYFVQSKITGLREKNEYDSLSEAEKWKRERETQKNSPQQSQVPVDPLTDAAAKVIFETGQASVSMLQRHLRIGYSQAFNLMENLEAIGVVGPFIGSRPREILISEDAYRKNAKSVDCALETSIKDLYSGINANQIIQDENEWRRKQQCLSASDYALSAVDRMGGHDFEQWCAGLLKKNGFSNVEVTKSSGDQGVDILAEKDGIRYAIQCKCYSSDLGNTPIQEVNTGRSIYHCQIGVVMTNRYFTSGAKEAAEATGVLLWDRDKIIQMIDSSI